jgi:glycine/D-amino acid oxidase-like deaminating enzyme
MPDAVLSPDFKTDPYWWEAAPRPEPEQVALPESVDVAVVGSGYTGLSAALTLARGGRDVIVLEADRLGEGASTRNGGYAAKISLFNFSQLHAKFGAERAITLYKETKIARDYTVGLIEGEQISCHHKTPGRLVAVRTAKQYEAAARDIELMRKLVDAASEMVSASEMRRELGSDFYQGGQILPDAGDLHPALYHQGLLDRVVSAGARVVGQTTVLGVAHENGGFAVRTGRGTLKAREVVLATNGHTGPATPYFQHRVIPIDCYTIATEPLAPDVMRELFPTGRTVIDTSYMFYAMRPSPDGSRLLFIGRTGLRDSDLRHTARELHRSMTEVFPMLREVGLTHCWRGGLGMTFDFMPHIGVREGMHFAIGMNGAGVLTGTYLGHKLGLRILGEADTETAFDGGTFPTMPFYRGKPWFMPLVMAYYKASDFFAR